MSSAFAEAFEAELSREAAAILAYARKWGTPFTRSEIVGIAPGAAWDTLSRYPQTFAAVCPIAELVKAKMIEVVDRRAVLIKPIRPTSKSRVTVKAAYKVYALTERLRVPSLAELLDMLVGATNAAGGTEGERFAEIRAEILDRFGGPR